MISVNTGLLFFIFSAARSFTSVDQNYLIPEILENFCVRGRVCRGHTTENRTYEIFGDLPPGKVPCCTACSCDADCEQSQCCFQERPAQDQTLSTNQQCLYTTTKQPQEWERHLYISYYMVTEPPLFGCTKSQKSTAKATTLQTFHPVSSKTSGKIYKNLTLALCYGEADILPWVPVFACEKYGETVNRLDVSSHALSILDINMYPQCRVSFYYPGDKSAIDSDRCYNDIIDKCSSNSTFSLPAGTNMSREAIIEACEGGFFSPYLMSGMHANVFCHICNGNRFNKLHGCPEATFSRSNPTTFVWILKMNVGININASIQGTRQACLKTKSQKDQCRVLHCPTGKLLTDNETCVWPFIDTGKRTIDIFLKLTPTKILTNDDLRYGLNMDDQLAYPAGLTSAWPKAWKLTYFAYFPRGSPNSSIDMFLARLQVFTNSPHDTILKSITVHLEKQWKLEIPGKHVKLDQDFSYQTRWIFVVNYHQLYTFTNLNHTGIEVREEVIIYRSADIRRNGLNINKLFFCEQIDTFNNEFTLNSDKTILTLNRSGRILLNAEFGLIEDSTERLSARICLSDSYFNKRIFKSSVRIKQACLIYMLATIGTLLFTI